jgi:hypothetical protein
VTGQPYDYIRQSILQRIWHWMHEECSGWGCSDVYTCLSDIGFKTPCVPKNYFYTNKIQILDYFYY